MKIQGSYPFATTPDRLWPFLFDPQVFCQIVPGCQAMQQIDDGRYEGRLLIRQGPLAGDYAISLILSDIRPQIGYAFHFTARSVDGVLEGNGRLHIEDQDGLIYLHYSGQAQTSGGLKQHADPLLETGARSIIRQALERLGQFLQSSRLNSVAPMLEKEAPATKTARWRILRLPSPPNTPPSVFYPALAIFAGLVGFVIWQRQRSRQAGAFAAPDNAL
jgi:uncharacterized protein